MSNARQQRLDDLKAFLRTIQKPNRPMDSVGVDDSLVASGLIDSLAMVQIVMYLETIYGIDFAASSIDPERLGSMASILNLLEEVRI